MKKDWEVTERENGQKDYRRSFYEVPYHIHELNDHAYEVSTDAIIINAIYPDFESAEQVVFREVEYEKKRIEQEKSIKGACKLDLLGFNFDTLKYEHVKMDATELGTVYISGKMDGLSKEEYVKRFKDVEQALVWQGVESILNPVKFKMQSIIKENNIDKADLFNPKYRNLFMREDIKQLIKADTICMIYDYKDSPGAMTEYSIAKALDMNIIYYPWKSITDWEDEWYKDEV